MDLPFDVQHRILDRLPLKTVLELRSLHSTFNNYFRFHCKTWRCFSLAIYQGDIEATTFLQLDCRLINHQQFAKCRNLIVKLLTITTSTTVHVGELGLLAKAGQLRATIVQVSSAMIDEKTREMIRNVHPKVIHLAQVPGLTNSWLSVPPSCEKLTITYWGIWGLPNDLDRWSGSCYNPVVDLTEAGQLKDIIINDVNAEKLTSEATKAILEKLRAGTSTRQMVDGMIFEMNNRARTRPFKWQYRETAERHYIIHDNVTFFIKKMTDCQ